MSEEKPIVFEPYILDSRNQRLWRRSEPVPLRRKTFAVLRYLAERPDRLVTTEELLERVWAGTVVGDGGLKVCVAELRRVLGDNVTTPRFIETVRGRGYRFIATSGRGPLPVSEEGARARSDRFIGRERELGILLDAMQGAMTGKGSVALVAGEAGIGKTRLASELGTRAARAGARVWVGRCVERGAVPFWPRIQILRAYTDSLEDDDIGAALGSAGPYLVQLDPFLQERLPQPPGRDALTPEEARFRLLDAFASLLRRISAAQPLVLLVDDLHWADRSSLLLLSHLGREISATSILIVATYRDREIAPTHPLSETVAELGREPGTTRLRLRGLTAVDSDALLRELCDPSPPPRLAAALLERTEGNPFFLEEMVRHLIESGVMDPSAGIWPAELSGALGGLPDGIRALLGRRLGQLGEPCRRVLGIAALLGREVHADVLRHVLAGDDASPNTHLLEALEEARRAHVIVDIDRRAPRFAFAHTLIREALIDDIVPLRRARLHGLIAATLERYYANELESHIAELAHHFVEAARAGGDPEPALTFATRAGDQAIAAVAHEAASEHYERALGILDLVEPGLPSRRRYSLLLDLGGAFAGARNPTPAREAYRKATEVARALGDREGFAQAVLGFSAEAPGFEGGRSRDDVSVALLEEARLGLGESVSALRAKVLARLSRIDHPALSPRRRAELSREAVRVARQAGYPAALAEALHSKYWARWGEEEARQRIETTAEMVRAAEAAGDVSMSQEGRLWRIVTLLELGELDEMDRELDLYRQVAESSRQPRYRWVVARLHAMRSLLDGDFAAAEAKGHEAFAIGRRVHERYAEWTFGVHVFALRHAQGRLAEIEAPLRALAREYPSDTGWRCTLAGLYSELGHEVEARHELEQLAASDFRDVARDTFWAAAIAILADVCAFLGDADRASVLHELLAPYADRNIVVGAGLYCIGAATRPLARLAATMSQWSLACRYFEAALELNRRLASPPLVARTQCDFAQVLLAYRSRGGRALPSSTNPKALLAEAEATARALGMAALLSRIEALKGVSVSGRSGRR